MAVVCHDAGATNIILAEMQASVGGKYLPVMQGPAAELWESSGRSASELLSLDEALLQARSVLTGTGWASCLEHDARIRARTLMLPSVAVIDHWVNYEARFQRHGQVVLPDEFWVTDDDAFTLASRCFPGQKVLQLPNHYLQTQIRSITPPSPRNAGHVLYVLEPIRFSWSGCTQPGEFEALDFFIKHLNKLGDPKNLRIRLRPHPSDMPGKYNAWLALNPHVNAALDRSTSLAEAISSAEWVAGCETTALAVALASGRKVIATLPPEAPRCRLPHQGLVHLRDLAENSSLAAVPSLKPRQ